MDYVAQDGTKVLINAFAGCGKTTTMREIVKRWRDMVHSGVSVHHNQRVQKRFLYLVFNRDAEQAAKTAFYKNDNNAAFVHVRTHHSLALKFFVESLREKIECKRPVGHGVAKALRKIDKTIANYKKHHRPCRALLLDDDDDDADDSSSNGSNKSVDIGCEDDKDDGQETGSDDDNDESEWSDDGCEGEQESDLDEAALADLSEIDAYEEYCYDKVQHMSESEHRESIARGENIVQPKNVLPLDLETDQMRPFGLDRGDPALDALQRFCRDSGAEADQIDGPTSKHVDFLQPLRAPDAPLNSLQQQVLSRARQAWHETINGRVNPSTGRLIVSHEATLKLFCAWSASSEAFIARQYHTVLFDEAQDIDTILMRWIEQASDFVCYLVGDACQSIYNFKGALNAMMHLSQAAAANNSNSNSTSNSNSSRSSNRSNGSRDQHNNLASSGESMRLKTFYLSQSFRFGEAVSRIANAMLEIAGRFGALSCAARLSSPAAKKSRIVHVTLPREIKRLRRTRPMTRNEIAAKYMAHIYNEHVVLGQHQEQEQTQTQKDLDMVVVARKNSTLLTLAIELASQNVFVSLTDKLLDRVRQGSLVLQHYSCLEHIDGRIDYLERVLRAVRQENAAEKLYRNLSAQADTLRVSGALGSNGGANYATPWYRFVKPLTNCGEATFSCVTARVCDQVLNELHILKLALQMRDLEKTKSAIAALLQRTIAGETTSGIILSTVHSCKGGEWKEVLLMNDFPDICTLVKALQWCRAPDTVALYEASDFNVAKSQLEKSLKSVLFSSVLASEDRDDAVRFILRTLRSAKTFAHLITSLDEEIHLYYVAVTRAKQTLHINVSLQRFQNKFAADL